MSAIDRAALIEAAAKAIHDVQNVDWRNWGNTNQAPYLKQAKAVLPVIARELLARELLAPLRQLHTGEWHCGNPQHTNPSAACPECDPYCEACGVPMPCPTVRLLDQIEADMKPRKGI